MSKNSHKTLKGAPQCSVRQTHTHTLSMYTPGRLELSISSLRMSTTHFLICMRGTSFVVPSWRRRTNLSWVWQGQERRGRGEHVEAMKADKGKDGRGDRMPYNCTTHITDTPCCTRLSRTYYTLGEAGVVQGNTHTHTSLLLCIASPPQDHCKAGTWGIRGLY